MKRKDKNTHVLSVQFLSNLHMITHIPSVYNRILEFSVWPGKWNDAPVSQPLCMNKTSVLRIYLAPRSQSPQSLVTFQTLKLLHHPFTNAPTPPPTPSQRDTERESLSQPLQMIQTDTQRGWVKAFRCSKQTQRVSESNPSGDPNRHRETLWVNPFRWSKQTQRESPSQPLQMIQRDTERVSESTPSDVNSVPISLLTKSKRWCCGKLVPNLSLMLGEFPTSSALTWACAVDGA